jgi:PAS domain S-box-containing protein
VLSDEAVSGPTLEAAFTAWLAAGESRMRLAAEAASLGVWDWDLVANTIVYSDRAKQICGFPLDRPVSFKQVRDSTHPDDHSRTHRLAQTAFDPKVRAKHSYDYRVVRPDGTIRWVMAHGEVVFETVDGVERAVRYVGTIQDITDRRLAEAALRTSEARRRSALDAAGMAVWDVDLTANAVTASPELNRLLGYPEDYAPTLDEINARYHPDDRELLRAVGRATWARGERFFEVEHRCIRPNGDVRWVLLRAELILGPEGAPTGALGVLIDITARKEAERALREGQERLRALADNIPNGMIYQLLATRQGERRFTYVSNNCERLNGVPAEAALADAQTLYARIDPAYLPTLMAAESESMQKLAAFEFETPMRGPDGRMRWFRLLSAPRTLADGSTVWDGIQLDIHDRKLADQQLRASEARFRAAIDAVQGVLWTNDASGEMRGEQPGWAALTGQSQAEYQGFGWAGAVHPDDAQPSIDAWKAAVAERRTFLFEHRVRRRDGVWRLFSIRAIPIFDADGDVLEWVGVHTDITQQRAAEQSLRELNETLEARIEERTYERDRLWALSEDLLVVADYGRYLRQVSPSWTRLLGHAQQSLLMRPYEELVHPEDLSALRNVVRTMRIGRRPVSVENRVLAADGAWRWIAWTFSPEPGGEGLIGVGRDVTAAKARQAELDLAQEALRQSQKLEAMGQLTGGVAHDFNNLLTPIIGSLDMLYRRGQGDARERRLIDGALQSAERAKMLVQRLLAFARRQPLQPGAVDLAALVTGMADLIASTSGPQIKVTVDVAADLPPAMADPNQLEMAILNLSVNARDAMPDGGGLTISAGVETIGQGHRSQLKPGPYVRLSVADTGAGMDEATLARAIEPFFSTKGIGKGTGLGLSMVHGLASQLGGALVLASKPGLGTNAALWLPVSPRPVETAGDSASPRTAKVIGRALLVDDEDIVRMTTADMLVEFGYEVVEASSGEEALRLLDAKLQIDVLVTDHLMPGMTGVDLARALRHRRPGTPVLIVSGFAEADGIAPDLPRLTKPFRQSDLAASLADLIPAAK